MPLRNPSKNHDIVIIMMLQRLIVPINLSHQTRKQSIEPEPSQESGPIDLPQHLHTHDRKYFQESRDEIS